MAAEAHTERLESTLSRHCDATVGVEERASGNANAHGGVPALNRSSQFQTLRDLRELRGRRKALERRSKHGVRVRGACGRLVEFCQPQSCAQFEATGGLMLRYRNRGQKASSARAGSAELHPSSISPRARCSSASNAR